jgi:DNA-3-methyladenine glycosylase I
MTKKRCGWLNLENALYVKYHDEEWGVPVHDDRLLFEMLCLEGAQAGLSWETILNKRESYRKAFHGFDPKKIIRMTDQDLEKRMKDPGIVRNRLKVWSVRENARAYFELKKEFGSLDNYLWSFVGGKPICVLHKSLASIPATTELSDKLSKDLKRRGFRFVGGTICYAFMQAVGLVNDHTADCFKFKINK